MLDDRWQQRHHSEHGEGVLMLFLFLLFHLLFVHTLVHILFALLLIFVHHVWMNLSNGVFIPFIPLATVFGYELLHD